MVCGLNMPAKKQQHTSLIRGDSYGHKGSVPLKRSGALNRMPFHIGACAKPENAFKHWKPYTIC